MNRIFIRSLLPGDEEAIYRIYSDMELCLASGSTPVFDMQGAKQKLNRLMQGGEYFAIVHTQTMQVIGVISLSKDAHRFNKHAYMLGYVLHRDWWGQGIMTEAVNYMLKFAFKNMGADVVAAAHFTDNERSKRVLQKCGFVYEGTMRRGYLRFDGAVLDSCIYSILYDEYLHKTVDNQNGR